MRWKNSVNCKNSMPSSRIELSDFRLVAYTKESKLSYLTNLMEDYCKEILSVEIITVITVISTLITESDECTYYFKN